MDTFGVLILLQIVSIAVLVAGSIHLFIHWKGREYSYLFLFSTTTLINNIGYLIEMTAADSNSALLGTRVAYLGKVFIPFAFFLFILQYCEIYLSRTVKLVMACFHILIAILVFTCRYQKLFYTSITYTAEGLFPHNVYGHGIMYNIYTAVLVFYLIGILVVVTYKMSHDTRHKRRIQMRYLLLCALCAITGFVAFLSGVSKGYDTTSISYMISMVFMAVALYKYDLLDTLALVRDYVTDNLSAGIIALDEDDRIIYSNQPAMDFFPNLNTDGKSITSSLIEAYRKKEMVFLDKRVYRPEYRELTKDGRQRGHIIVLSDITDNYQYTMLMKKMTEIDILTGLHNRLTYEYDISELRKQAVLPQGLVLFSMDVNGLKNVNDTYGHSAGDEMIRDAADCIAQAVKDLGTCYRTGGDEFAVILTSLEAEPESICRQIDQRAAEVAQIRSHPFSISVGYCAAGGCRSDRIEKIKEQADKMMYRNKENFYLSNGIDRRTQSEAFLSLCENYIKVIQADLVTEQCKIIKMDTEEQTDMCGFSDSLGLWLRHFAEMGMVAEKDRAVFTESTEPSHLSQYFQKGEKRFCLNYSRRVGTEYRNVMLEVIPARNFTSACQSVYLYVKEG